MKKFLNACRGAHHHSCTLRSCAKEAGKKAHLPVSTGRTLITYFPSCCLRVWLPISQHLGANYDSTLWDTDRLWHTLSYWAPLRTKLRSSQTFERQPRATSKDIESVLKNLPTKIIKMASLVNYTKHLKN